MIKITIPAARPRNPLVVAGHKRLAGAHRRSGGAQRQQAQQALRRAVQHERYPDT